VYENVVFFINDYLLCFFVISFFVPLFKKLVADKKDKENFVDFWFVKQ